MTILSNLPITAPLTAFTTAPLQFLQAPENVAVEANFTFGSGGTSVAVWLQTSLDGGGTWIDVASWSFTTASARSVANLSALTPNAEFAPTDGTLAAGSVKDGVIGALWRAKITSVGTYAATSLRIDVRGGLTQ